MASERGAAFRSQLHEIGDEFTKMRIVAAWRGVDATNAGAKL